MTSAFSPWMLLGAALFAAFVLNLVLTPLIHLAAHRFGWLDAPNHRTIHSDPTPRLGGVGIVASFGVIVLAALVVDWLHPLGLPTIARSFVVLFLGLGFMAMHLVGILDDFIEFRAFYKVMLQMIGGLLAIGSGAVINHLTVPFTGIVLTLGSLGPLVTLLWILGVTNAVNLIDGVDGLAGGIVSIALLFIGFWGLATGHLFQALACATALGAVLAFLVFNLPPAKIFMGDSGSLALGYLIAILAVWGGDYSLFHQFWLLPFTLVLIPVGDTMAAIMRRLRTNRAVWSPDKEHTHHKLLALGLKPRQVLFVMYSLMAITSSPVLVASVTPGAPPLLAALSIGSGVLVLVLFLVLHHVYRRRFPDLHQEMWP